MGSMTFIVCANLINHSLFYLVVIIIYCNYKNHDSMFIVYIIYKQSVTKTISRNRYFGWTLVSNLQYPIFFGNSSSGKVVTIGNGFNLFLIHIE